MSNPQHRPSMTGSNGRPLEFWGLRSIAQRMGCSVDQLHRLHDQLQFPLILMPNWKRRHPRNMAFKWIYYTNEAFIDRWYMGLSMAQRKLRRKFGGRWWRILGKAGRGDLRAEADQKPDRARGAG